MPSQIEFTLNGDRREVPAGWSVDDLVRSLDLRPETVAVEVNREILKRVAWAAREIAAGDTIEIVHFVGGG